MALYYVENNDKRFGLVVKANSKWCAREEAHTYMLQEYNLDIPIYDWTPQVCTNSFIIVNGKEVI